MAKTLSGFTLVFMVALLATGALQAQAPAAQAPAEQAPAAQAPAPASAKYSDLDAIWKYAGNWQIHTDVFDTPYSKEASHTSSLHNDCWRSGAYIACRQIVDGQSNVLIVFTCGGKDHTCTSYQIPSEGSPATNGPVRIEGDTWTFPWQTTDADGKTTYFRVVNVWTSPTYIEYRQEYSTDQLRWTKTAVGHETKTDSK